MSGAADTPIDVAPRPKRRRWQLLDGLHGTRRGQWLALAGWVGLCVVGGGAIGVLTGGGTSAWYAALAKPSWLPPSWLFAPVWTTLYALMGVAAWRIWRLGNQRKWDALDLFIAQLACNFAWSPLFFTWRRPDLALVDIVVLWSLILLTVAEFTRLDRAAARLLWPYLAWVTFAAMLNVAIVAMN